MTFLWVDQWTRHCVWFKHSSTLTSMEKVPFFYSSFFLNFIFLFDNVIYVFIMNLVFFIPHYPFIYFSHQNSSPFYQAPSYFCGFIGGDPLSLIRVACMNMTGGGVIFWIMGNLLVAISLKKMIPPIECFSEEWGLCSPPLIHERMLTCPVLYR